MKTFLAFTAACLIASAAARADSAQNRISAERRGLFAFTPKAGVTAPTGNYGRLSKTGLGLQAAVEYYLTDRWAVGLSVGYARSTASDQAKRNQEAALTAQAAQPVSGQPLSRPAPDGTDRAARRTTSTPVSVDNWKMNTVQYGVYARHIISVGTSKIAPYLAAGMGIYQTGGSVSGTGLSQAQLEQATGTQGKTSWGANLGTGLMYSFTPAISLALGVSYHDAFTRPTTNYFVINGGLSFLTDFSR